MILQRAAAFSHYLYHNRLNTITLRNVAAAHENVLGLPLCLERPRKKQRMRGRACARSIARPFTRDIENKIAAIRRALLLRNHVPRDHNACNYIAKASTNL